MMEYREWKEISKTCPYRKSAKGRVSKASSRGKTGHDCIVHGKPCKMSGCLVKSDSVASMDVIQAWLTEHKIETLWSEGTRDSGTLEIHPPIDGFVVGWLNIDGTDLKLLANSFGTDGGELKGTYDLHHPNSLLDLLQDLKAAFNLPWRRAPEA